MFVTCASSLTVLSYVSTYVVSVMHKHFAEHIICAQILQGTPLWNVGSENHPRWEMKIFRDIGILSFNLYTPPPENVKLADLGTLTFEF